MADKFDPGKVIKHPGALTAEAKASGRSKLQQAIHDSHSSDPKERSRGNLGKVLLTNPHYRHGGTGK